MPDHPTFPEWYEDGGLVLPVVRATDEVPGLAGLPPWPDSTGWWEVFVRLLVDVAERNGAGSGTANYLARRVLAASASSTPSAEGMSRMCRRVAELALGRA